MNAGFWTAAVTAACFAALFLSAFQRNKERDRSRKRIVASINSMRGLFALEILVGHAVMHSGCGMPLDAYEKFLFVSVGFFFFASAFSIMHALDVRPSYFDGFWKKPVTLAAFACISFLYDCLIALLSGTFAYYRAGENFAVLFFQRTNWFLWELAGFYILFFLCFRTYHEKQGRAWRCILLFAAAAAVMTALYALEMQPAWYISTAAFPTGILAAAFYDEIRSFLFSRKGIGIGLLLVTAGLFSIAPLPIQEQYLGAVLLHNVFIAGSVILILLFSSLWNRSAHSKVYGFFQSHSLALYLSQFIFMRISDSRQFSLAPRMCLVIGGSVISAALLQPLYDAVKGCIRGRMKHESA